MTEMFVWCQLFVAI